MAGEGDSSRLPNGRSATGRTKSSRRSLAASRRSGGGSGSHPDAAAAAAEAGHDASPSSKRDAGPSASAECKTSVSKKSDRRPSSRAAKTRRRAPANRRRTTSAAATAASTSAAAAPDEQTVSSTSPPVTPEQADRHGPARVSTEQQQQQQQLLGLRQEALLPPKPPDVAGQQTELAEEVEQEGEVEVKAEPEEEHEVEQQQQNRRSVGVLTDADCLGPCEPGTHVNLDGIVWQETANGVLVINVTWRGKTYMGTLLDATKHDWAPPRLQCESPSSDAETRMSKSRIKRRPTLSATFQDISERKLRRQCRSSGSQSELQAAPASADRAAPAGTKRKAKPAAAVAVAGGEAAGRDAAVSDRGPVGGAGQPNGGEHSHCSTAKRRRRSSSCGFGANGGISRMAAAPGEAPHVNYLPCPEPGCTRKYRQTSSLRHHLRQVHRPLKAGDDDGVAAASGSSGSSDGASAVCSPAEDAPGNSMTAQQQQQQQTALVSARSCARLSKERKRLSRSSSSASPEAASAAVASSCKSEREDPAAAVAGLATSADAAETRLRSSRSCRQPRSCTAPDDIDGTDDNCSDRDVLHGGSGAAASAFEPASLVPSATAGPAGVCAPSDEMPTSVAAVSPKASGERGVCGTVPADASKASPPSAAVVEATTSQPSLPEATMRLDVGDDACVPGRPAVVSLPSPDAFSTRGAAETAAAVCGAAIAAPTHSFADGCSRLPMKPDRDREEGEEEVPRCRPGEAPPPSQFAAANVGAAPAARRVELGARGCSSWLPAQQLQQLPQQLRQPKLARRRPRDTSGQAAAVRAAAAAAAAEKELAGGVYSDVSDEGLLAESDARPSELRAAIRAKDEQQRQQLQQQHLRGPLPAGCSQFAYPVVAVSPRKADKSESMHAPSVMSSDGAAEVPASPFLGRSVSRGLPKRPRSGEAVEAAVRAGSRGGSGGGTLGDSERLAALESYYRQQQLPPFGLPYYPWAGPAPLSPYEDAAAAAAASSFLQLMDWRAKSLERHGVDSLFGRATTPSSCAGMPDGGGFCHYSGWEQMSPNVAMPLDMHASRYEVLRESIELKSQMSRLPSPRGGRSSGSGGVSQQPQPLQGLATKPPGGSPCDSESSLSSTASSSASYRKQQQQQRQRVHPAVASPTPDHRAPMAVAHGDSAPPSGSPLQRSSVVVPGSGSSSRCVGAAPSLPLDCAAVARRPAAQAPLPARSVQQWSRQLAGGGGGMGTPPPPPIGWPVDRACLAPAFASSRLSPLDGLPPLPQSASTAACAAAATVPKGSAMAATATSAADDKKVVGFVGSASAELYPQLVPGAVVAIDSRVLDAAACRLRQHKIHELGDVAL